MKIVAIIQARMGSTRLPGKVLADLAGEPMLTRVVRRVQRTPGVAQTVVATTTEAADDAIEALCRKHDWPCFRGDQNDVLDRYYKAACEHQADAVVRVTSDCPFIEPEVIRQVVTEFLEHQPGCEYVANTLNRRTLPRGLDTEIVRFDTLERTWREAKTAAQREHVTPYIYGNPHLFQLHSVYHPTDLSNLRWTVDTTEDLEFARLVYDHFGHDRFSWQEVLKLLEIHPDWQEINRHIEQKVV